MNSSCMSCSSIFNISSLKSYSNSRTGRSSSSSSSDINNDDGDVGTDDEAIMIVSNSSTRAVKFKPEVMPVMMSIFFFMQNSLDEQMY